MRAFFAARGRRWYALAAAVWLALIGKELSSPSAAKAQPSGSPAMSTPCAGDPNFEQFDFLLGHWQVFQKDQQTAEVTFEKAFKGCGVTEVWHGIIPGRQSGMGLMTYSRLRHTVTWDYVGDQPVNSVSAKAETKPGDITFLLETPSPMGRGTLARRWRVYLRPDGTVSETSNSSDNGGPVHLDYEMIWKKSN